MTNGLTALRDDLRYLGAIDRRHSFLESVPDRWFQNKGYTVLTERAVDGTPLVGVALEYPSVCPVDATATMQIRYWLGNLDRRAELLAAYIKNIVAINDHMASVGASRVWGAVPKKATHLTSFLEPAALAGACRQVDGAGITLGDAMDEEDDCRNFWFFIGDRQTVTDFMQAVP